MMAILAKQQEACKVLYETEGLQGFILSVFNQEQDPFDMPKNQRDAAITNTLKEVAQEAGIVRRGQRVLLSSILLQMLASLSDNMAAYIRSKSPSTNLLVDDVLTKSLEFLIMDMAWLRQTSEFPNRCKHMSLSDLIDLDRVLNILRILEVASRGSIAVSELLMTRPKFFQIVTQLLVLSRRHASQGADQNDAVTLMIQVLRLLVNVTHKNEAFCEMLAHHDAVSALVVNIFQLHLLRQRKSRSPTRRQDTGEDVIQDWYDVLLLSVGLVINMLEKNSKRKHEFLNTAISLECPGIGPCLQGDCSCLTSNQVLERVIEMYRAETHLQVEGNVLAAYLAVLIIRVVEDEEAGQDRLVRAVGMEGLQDMGLLLDNFGSLYRSLLESISEEERVSEHDEDSTVEGKKATSKDEMIRDTHQSILITIQILKRIQNSRMNGE
ncbi:hypothetical protein BGW42_000668 [Actinomortierella wolfii]|nr:hypothetical protein BGW42_000668 [Actinomortierella wolfii]